MKTLKLKRDLVIPAGTEFHLADYRFPGPFWVGHVDLDGQRKASLEISRGAIDANPDILGEKTEWEELRDGKTVSPPGLIPPRDTPPPDSLVNRSQDPDEIDDEVETLIQNAGFVYPAPGGVGI